MRRSVICISHSTGAGGEEVGRRVAEQLEMRYLDEEIVGRAAAASGVSPADLRNSERRRGALEKIFRYFGEAALSTDGSLPPVADHTEAHRVLIREAIEATAEEGNAVIVAHAASLTLGHRSDVLRVLVTGSPETRATRIAGDGGEGTARDVIRKSDAGRAAYLRSFYGVSQELPTHYDLVVNTDTITVEEAGELVAALADDR